MAVSEIARRGRSLRRFLLLSAAINPVTRNTCRRTCFVTRHSDNRAPQAAKRDYDNDCNPAQLEGAPLVRFSGCGTVALGRAPRSFGVTVESLPAIGVRPSSLPGGRGVPASHPAGMCARILSCSGARGTIPGGRAG